jgi:hypothetical protein
MQRNCYLRTVCISYDIRAHERKDTKEKKIVLTCVSLTTSKLTTPHLHAYAIRERKCSALLPSVSLLSCATMRAYSYKILGSAGAKKKSVQYMLKTWSNHVQTLPERNLYFKVNYCLEKFRLTSGVL